MPIYAYRCDACGHQMDILQKMSDSAPACPECGHASMTKQITAAAFDLKGSGWYKTDFASKGCAASSNAVASDPPPCAVNGECACKAASETE